MNSPPYQREDLSDSDEEVPVVQLCCLPFAEVQTLDLSTTRDFSVLLEVLVIGDEARALSALSNLYWVSQKVIDVGGVDILFRAMKHKCERIRVQATLKVTYLSNSSFKKLKKKNMQTWLY